MTQEQMIKMLNQIPDKKTCWGCLKEIPINRERRAKLQDADKEIIEVEVCPKCFEQNWVYE